VTSGPTIFAPGGRRLQSVALTSALGAARRPADLLPAWPLVFSMLDRFAGSYALLVKRLVTVELPPVLLQCGVDDPVRDGNERMQRHLAAWVASCELQLWSAPVHNFQMFGRLLPEARTAIREIGRFARSATDATPTERINP
jgi:acetyl esterase/lipase